MGIEKAVWHLQEAIRKDGLIMVIGDFDTDGATGTALCLLALRALGAKKLDYLIPNRFSQGYGLSIPLVHEAARLGTMLIVTVDNGIHACASVTTANALGIEVIITDHHLPGPELPAAAAIVNPNLANCPFPSKALCGVGVIFYVMLALRAAFREAGVFSLESPEPNFNQYLDLVALGTVADMVPLDQNNRILVAQGLRRIQQGKACKGLQSLLKLGTHTTTFTDISAKDLGFIVAPRLNAAGRLEDMAMGVKLLMSSSELEADQLALNLDALNRRRRRLERTMRCQAVTCCDDLLSTIPSTSRPAGWVVHDPNWHEGIIGLLAARLKDYLYRPVIAFCSSHNGILKGSGRSLPGIDLYDLLSQLDRLYPNMLCSFGGHAMAVGLSIAPHAVNRFRHAFLSLLDTMVLPDQFKKIIWSDGCLQPDSLTIELAKVLVQAGPWGTGFLEPTFDGFFDINRQEVVGEQHLRLTLFFHNTTRPIEAIYFNVNAQKWPNNDLKQAHIAYNVAVNRYLGKETLQLVIQEIWPN